MKNIFTTINARVLLAISALLLGFAIGCGSNPVAPDPPFEYRLQVYDGRNGGKVVEQIWVPQGESTWVWVQLQCRAIINGTSGPWGPVTSEEMMDVTVKGIPSGDDPVDLGALPAQCRLKAGAEQQLSFWPPLGGHGGSTVVVLSVPTRKGAWLGLTVTVTAPSGGGGVNPPSAQTCRDLHPTSEYDSNGNLWDCDGGIWKIVIPAQKTCRDLHPCAQYDSEGNLWDCKDGNWVIVDPVDPPLGEFHAHGSFGILNSGGTLHIMKGRAETVQLFVGDLAVDSQDVTAKLPLSLPWWVWLPATSEISTVYTLGNPVFVPVGIYQMSLWYQEKEFSFFLDITPNPELGD